MFGYVRVHSPELRVKEYEFYRGTYCGLCRSMGKCTGQCSRMTLSYDFAFLALLRLTFLRESVEFGQKRCMAHPLKKRNYMKRNASLDFCSGAAALLNYHKILDDLNDETGLKRLRALLARPFMAHSRKKALKQGLGELDTAIAAGLAELSRIEASRVASVDQPAACFGSILGAIVAYGLEGAEARLAKTLEPPWENGSTLPMPWTIAPRIKKRSGTIPSCCCTTAGSPMRRSWRESEAP